MCEHIWVNLYYQKRIDGKQKMFISPVKLCSKCYDYRHLIDIKKDETILIEEELGDVFDAKF